MQEEAKNNSKVFDVKKAFFEKNPKLAKWLPGFVLRYLRKIVHEDLINELIRDYGHWKVSIFQKP